MYFSLIVDHKWLKISCFQKRPKDGTASASYNDVSIGPVNIYEVKRFQCHLLAPVENN